MLPSFQTVSKEGFQQNFFAAALTWIFAHEVGHLAQEHGYIREKFGKATQVSAEIHECEAMNGAKKLSPEESLISHVTELAADYEATNWCFFELVRHYRNEDGSSSDLFLDGAFVFVCAITCTFYRFNGVVAIEPKTEPTGSHPHNIFRIEKNLSHLIELIDDMGSADGVRLSRKELVHLYHRAATAASFFWYSQHAKPQNIVQEFVIGRAINHPNMRKYMPKIVQAWDQIEGEIKEFKRFKLGMSSQLASGIPVDFGLMCFTEDFRRLYC